MDGMEILCPSCHNFELLLSGRIAVLAPQYKPECVMHTGRLLYPCVGAWPGMQIPNANFIGLFWICQRYLGAPKSDP